MLIYNTTYHVEEGEDKNFLIWMQEHYLPEVEKNGTLYAPRIARILSHIEEGSICYSVQFGWKTLPNCIVGIKSKE